MSRTVKVMLLIVLGALLLAVAVFLIVTNIPQGSAEDTAAAPGASAVNVFDTPVFLDADPNKQVVLKREAQQAAQQADAGGEEQAQAQEGQPEAEAQLAQPGETPIIVTVTPDPITIPTITPIPPATAIPPVVATPLPGVPPVVTIGYVVQPEDTLYRLTVKHNTTIELMAQFNIASGSLVTGATIQLPIANQAYCGNSPAYIVRSGDTVFSVARRHNVSVDQLKARNGIGADNRININQVLCIP